MLYQLSYSCLKSLVGEGVYGTPADASRVALRDAGVVPYSFVIFSRFSLTAAVALRVSNTRWALATSRS